MNTEYSDEDNYTGSDFSYYKSLEANMADADFEVSGGGSLYILTPLNDSARENLEQGVGDEAQWFAGGVAVEHRYIVDLVERLREQGFVVR